MKKFIDTLRNIWTIKELRQRILFTLGMLMVYRFGTFIVLPGVIPGQLNAVMGQRTDLLGLINSFTGGAFGNASIFALGIMPYITASIIIQLMGFAVPYFQRLQQKEGESGRKKLNQITRLLTVAITLVQGGAYLSYVTGSEGVVSGDLPPSIFWFSSIIILSSGTIFAMWLGERITDRGIGNGISLLIMIGIIATLPSALGFELVQGVTRPFLLVFELAAFFVVTMATILIVQGVRRIPIQFAKRMVGRGNRNIPQAGVRDYIPLKVNAAGVMPIIFAQALMFLPMTVAQYFAKDGDASQAGDGIIGQLNDPFSLTSSIIAFVLVVVFTYIYTALLVNPQQYAEYLKRQNAFIPGIKPGKATADFIDTVTTRVTLPGSIFLGIITILPAVAVAFGINQGFAIFFGGTSLLILVGVVLDTLQQIESHLLMRKYDGLVKSGRLKGRSGMQSIGAPM